MTIPTFVDEGPLVEGDPPVAFRVTYQRRQPDGSSEQVTDTFECLPRSQVPYVWILDYFASGIGDPTEQSVATLQFFDRVLLDNAPDLDDEEEDEEGEAAPAEQLSDRARFDQLIHDPRAAIKGRTLQTIQIYLLEQYERPDPTRARSAGPARSRSGRSSTGRGSTARPPAKASTSR